MRPGGRGGVPGPAPGQQPRVITFQADLVLVGVVVLGLGLGLGVYEAAAPPPRVAVGAVVAGGVAQQRPALAPLVVVQLRPHVSLPLLLLPHLLLLLLLLLLLVLLVLLLLLV